jgi:type II restriction/modification system DNA methylase subunit YeeA
VRPWVNAKDFSNRPRRFYIIDFGVSISREKAALYELPFQYLHKHVEPKRAKNRRTGYAENWWIHGEPRSELRKKIKDKTRFMLTPGVSKHRTFEWFPTTTIPDHAIFAFARDDDYFFGVLQSTAHELWARAQGTQLREVESGFRYTPRSTFDTFPFPWPPNQEPKDSPLVEAIASAARNLVQHRDAWLNPPDTPESELKKRTLTNLYNQRPTWLADAHRILDEAVFAAYGWPTNLTTQEILSRLLALNHERASSQPVKIKPSKPKAAPKKTTATKQKPSSRWNGTHSDAAE